MAAWRASNPGDMTEYAPKPTLLREVVRSQRKLSESAAFLASLPLSVSNGLPPTVRVSPSLQRTPAAPASPNVLPLQHTMLVRQQLREVAENLEPSGRDRTEHAMQASGLPGAGAGRASGGLGEGEGGRRDVSASMRQRFNGYDSHGNASKRMEGMLIPRAPGAAGPSPPGCRPPAGTQIKRPAGDTGAALGSAVAKAATAAAAKMQPRSPSQAADITMESINDTFSEDEDARMFWLLTSTTPEAEKLRSSVCMLAPDKVVPDLLPAVAGTTSTESTGSFVSPGSSVTRTFRTVQFSFSECNCRPSAEAESESQGKAWYCNCSSVKRTVCDHPSRTCTCSRWKHQNLKIISSPNGAYVGREMLRWGVWNKEIQKYDETDIMLYAYFVLHPPPGAKLSSKKGWRSFWPASSWHSSFLAGEGQGGASLVGKLGAFDVDDITPWLNSGVLPSGSEGGSTRHRAWRQVLCQAKISPLRKSPSQKRKPGAAAGSAAKRSRKCTASRAEKEGETMAAEQGQASAAAEDGAAGK